MIYLTFSQTFWERKCPIWFFCFFFKVASRPDVGLKLTTLRSSQMHYQLNQLGTPNVSYLDLMIEIQKEERKKCPYQRVCMSEYTPKEDKNAWPMIQLLSSSVWILSLRPSLYGFTSISLSS